MMLHQDIEMTEAMNEYFAPVGEDLDSQLSAQNDNVKIHSQ